MHSQKKRPGAFPAFFLYLVVSLRGKSFPLIACFPLVCSGTGWDGGTLQTLAAQGFLVLLGMGWYGLVWPLGKFKSCIVHHKNCSF